MITYEMQNYDRVSEKKSHVESKTIQPLAFCLPKIWDCYEGAMSLFLLFEIYNSDWRER